VFGCGGQCRSINQPSALTDNWKFGISPTYTFDVLFNMIGIGGLWDLNFEFNLSEF
jgi:hypothetical protein